MRNFRFSVGVDSDQDAFGSGLTETDHRGSLRFGIHHTETALVPGSGTRPPKRIRTISE